MFTGNVRDEPGMGILNGISKVSSSWNTGVSPKKYLLELIELLLGCLTWLLREEPMGLSENSV